MDLAWLSLMHEWRQPQITAIMGAVTWLGSLAVLLPLALLAGWRQGDWRRRAFLPAAVLGAAGLAQVIKWLVDRPRPDAFPSLIAMPADASFPSAHAMQVAAFVTAWLLWSNGMRRADQVAVGMLVVVAVGVSRTYLQVHFLTDVLFGIVAGALWAVLLNGLPIWKREA